MIEWVMAKNFDIRTLVLEDLVLTPQSLKNWSKIILLKIILIYFVQEAFLYQSIYTLQKNIKTIGKATLGSQLILLISADIYKQKETAWKKVTQYFWNQKCHEVH